MAADMLGVRMAHLESAYEQLDKRLGSLEGRLVSLAGEVRDLRRDVHDQFRLTVGLLIVAIFSPIVLRLIGH